MRDALNALKFVEFFCGAKIQFRSMDPIIPWGSTRFFEMTVFLSIRCPLVATKLFFIFCMFLIS